MTCLTHWTSPFSAYNANGHRTQTRNSFLRNNAEGMREKTRRVWVRVDRLVSLLLYIFIDKTGNNVCYFILNSVIAMCGFRLAYIAEISRPFRVYQRHVWRVG